MLRYVILTGLIGVVLLWGVQTGEAAYPASAKSMAMGGAYVALSEGVDGVWHNPSGTAEFRGAAVQLGYAMLYGGLGDDVGVGSAAALLSLGSVGNLGVGVSMLSCDLRSQDAAGGVTNAWRDQTLAGSFSREFGALSLGATLKMMMWSADGQYGADASSSAMTLDVGALYRLGGMFGLESVRAGALLSNVLPANLSESDDDGGKLPLGVGLGIGVTRGSALGSMDLRLADGDVELRGGLEVETTGLRLRIGGLGIANAEDMPKGEVDFGIGTALKGVQLDYAYVYPLLTDRELGGHQLFTLGYKF